MLGGGQSKKRTRHCQAVGPRTLHEVLRSVKWSMESLVQAAEQDHGLLLQLQEVARHGLIVTTSYSGTGGLEFSVSQWLSRLRELLGGKGSLVCYSACDLSKGAQKALMGHEGERLYHTISSQTSLTRSQPLSLNS